MASEDVAVTPDQAALAALAYDLRDIAVRIAERAMRTDGGPEDPAVLSTLLLLRGLNQFEGVLLLADHGLGGEARTLTRGLVETAICIAYLHTRPDDFVTRLKADDDASRRGQAHALLAGRNLGAALSDADQRDLRDFVARLKADAPRFLDIADMAQDAPTGSLYLLYRILSGDAAHVSLASLGRHLKPAGESEAAFITARDDVANIHATLDYAFRSFIAVCVAHTTIVGDRQHNRDLAELEHRMRELPRLEL